MDVYGLQRDVVSEATPPAPIGGYAKSKYEVIAKHGLKVVVMEGIRGGRLANLPDEEMKKLLRKEAFAARTQAYCYAFFEAPVKMMQKKCCNSL